MTSKGECCKCGGTVSSLGDVRFKRSPRNCEKCEGVYHEKCNYRQCSSSQKTVAMFNTFMLKTALDDMQSSGGSTEQIFMFYLLNLPVGLACKILDLALDIINFDILKQNLTNVRDAHSRKKMLMETLQLKTQTIEFLSFEIKFTHWTVLKDISNQTRRRDNVSFIFVLWWVFSQFSKNTPFRQTHAIVSKLLRLKNLSIDCATQLIFSTDETFNPLKTGKGDRMVYLRFAGIKKKYLCLFNGINPLILTNSTCQCVKESFNRDFRAICSCKR